AFDTTAPVDTAPPALSARAPLPNATGVAMRPAISATFDEAVQANSIVFTLAGPAGALAGTVSYDPASRTATLTPGPLLELGATYTATLSGVRDLAGNAM